MENDDKHLFNYLKLPKIPVAICSQFNGRQRLWVQIQIQEKRRPAPVIKKKSKCPRRDVQKKNILKSVKNCRHFFKLRLDISLISKVR